MAMPAEQSYKMIPECRLGQPIFQPSRSLGIILEHTEVFAILQTAREFDFSELNGLEATRRAQPISKLDEIGRHHCLEDAELRDKKANNGGEPAFQTFTLDLIILIEHLEDCVDLMEHEFE